MLLFSSRVMVQVVADETPASVAVDSQSTSETTSATSETTQSQITSTVSVPALAPEAAKPDNSQPPAATDAAKPTAKTDPVPAGAVQPVTQDLLKSDFSATWDHFSSKEGAITSVWQIVQSDSEPQLKCLGEPRGFLFTKQKYSNFEMTLDWRYASDPNGNGGILVFAQGEPRLWPTSMQIQLHQPRAGCIFPTGDATSDNSSEAAGLALESGMWNTCRIVSQDGRLSVEINNKKAGEVTGCKPAIGAIAIQCEGSETWFRRIQIKSLPATEASEPPSTPKQVGKKDVPEKPAPKTEPGPSTKVES